MPYPTLYPAQPNSPSTELAADVTAVATNMVVVSGAMLPDPPALLTIGIGDDAETVLMTAKVGNNLSVVRGVEGDVQAWSAGETIARNFTAKDHNDLIAWALQLKADVEGKAASNHTQAASTVTLEAIDGMSSLQVQAAVAELKGRTDNNQTETQAVRVVAEGAAGAAATAGQRAEKGITDAAAAQTTATNAATAAATADGKAVAAQSAAATAQTAADTANTRADEAFQQASSGRAAIAGAIGAPASPEDTHTQLAGRVNTAKATLAMNLTEKGVESASTEPLERLASLVEEIVTEPEVMPGDVLLFNATVPVGAISSTTPVEYVSIRAGQTGGVGRFRFVLTRGTTAPSAYGQIYRNGSPYGQLRVNDVATPGTPLTFTEDLQFFADDIFSVYLWASGGANSKANSFQVLSNVLPYFRQG